MRIVLSNKKKSNNKVKINYRNSIICGICYAFYLIMAFSFEPVLASDSSGYINMISAREPVYPLFLAFCKFLYGVKYLQCAVVLQNLLMAMAVHKLVMELDKIFKLSIFRISLILLSFVAMSGICIFFTARGVPYTNVILTEGLAQPLWIFFIYLLIKGFYEDNLKNIYSAIFLSALLMDIRKQMAIGFIVVFLTVLIGWFKRKDYIKKLIYTSVAIIIGVILAFGITRTYNYFLRGEFTQNTRDMNLVLTTSLYVSDREDADLIKDEAAKNLFLKVSDQLEENECTYAYSKKGLSNLQKHYSDSYDKITINTTADLFVEDAIERGFEEGIEAEKEADRVSAEIVKSLLMDNIGKYFMVYMSSLGEGLVNTIAKRSNILDIYAIFAYLIYIFLMVKNLSSPDGRKRGLFGMIILIAILVNVGVTSALIFCQTRYMIYNMPLFYIALIIMIPFDKIAKFPKVILDENSFYNSL